MSGNSNIWANIFG